MRIHGKNGQVQMDPLGGAAVVPVGDINAWTLDLKKDRTPVTAFGDTNIIRVVGLPDFSGTLGGWWNSVSAPVLFDTILGDVAPFLHLIPNTLEGTFLFKGLANIDGSINVPATGGVSFSGTWDAAGNWVREP